MELFPNYDIKDREADIAKWFIDFEANRAADEMKAPEEQDPRLVVYHERVSHSSDSEDSLLYRHNFLKENLLATVHNRNLLFFHRKIQKEALMKHNDK